MQTDRAQIRLALEWLPAGMTLAMAVLLQSCVLAAMAGLFAVGAFYDRMDREPLQRPLQCAIRCVLAGFVALIAAAVLATMLATHFGGAWNPTELTAIPGLVVLLLSVGIWFARGERDIALRPYPALIPWAALLGGVALLMSFAWKGPLAQCVFAAAAAAVLAWSAWRLMGIVVPIMNRGSTR